MELAVISGKGGTGKSSISAAFATIEENCVIADCDVDAANLYLLFQPEIEKEEIFVSGSKAVIDKELCTNCGICESYCRFDAIHQINGQIEISETSCDGCKLCMRVCPFEAIHMVEENRSRLYAGTYRNGKIVYGRLAPGEENSGRLVDLVRDEAKNLSTTYGLQTIILDGPPGIGCPVISTVTGVDKVVIVTEPTLSGLHDLKRTLQLLTKFNSSWYVIINKADLNSEMSDEIEKFSLEKGVNFVVRVPFEELFVKAMIDCKSVVEKDPESQISKILIDTYLRIKSH